MLAIKTTCSGLIEGMCLLFSWMIFGIILLSYLSDNSTNSFETCCAKLVIEISILKFHMDWSLVQRLSYEFEQFGMSTNTTCLLLGRKE